MKIEYQERTIDEVLSWFVRGFTFGLGEKVKAWDANYDPHIGKVIFKLYIKEPKKKVK